MDIEKRKKRKIIENKYNSFIPKSTETYEDSRNSFIIGKKESDISILWIL
jgi:hypothetical protein